MSGQMTPQQQAEAQAALALASAATVGRFQGFEQFDVRTQSHASPLNQVQYPPLNLMRPCSHIGIQWKGRITVSVGAYADVGAESPQALLQRILIEGQHTDFGNITILDMTGATAYAYGFLTQDRQGSNIYISKAGGALTAQAQLDTPMAGQFDGAVATHDVILNFVIPFGPAIGIGNELKRWLNSFLLMPGDFGNNLRLSLTWGDATALGDTTGATVAFSAFQSATGSPEVSVHLCYSILGPFEKSGPQGLILRQERLLTTFTSLGNDLAILDLQKRITPNVLIKAGLVEDTGQSAGVFTFDSLSDLMLERTQIEIDNKRPRQATKNLLEKARINGMFGTRPIQGYHLLTFVDGQNPLLAYRAEGLPGGAQMRLRSNIESASANNRLQVLQEQVIGGPYPALRP